MLNDSNNEELRALTYCESIRHAFTFLFENYSEVFAIGQGLWAKWYVGETMLELEKIFGKDRVIDTPVSEAATTGIAIGASLAGYKPIVIHPRMDFVLNSCDQLINQAAKWSYMLGGQASPGLTIRAIINRGGEQGAQHSQALHSMFANIPGLKVVMPHSVQDAGELLIASVLDPSPVLYIDDRWLYQNTESVRPCRAVSLSEFGPKIIKAGSDLTLVAAGFSVQTALETASALDKENISSEVIDLRLINPLDYTEITASVRKTGRLLVIDGGWANCGLSGEIIAGVCERLEPSELKCKPARINIANAPAPSSSALENIYYPKSDLVVNAVLRMLSK